MLIIRTMRGEGAGEIPSCFTSYRINEVLKADGRAVQLMTKSPSFFEYWSFRVMRDYMGEGWKLMTLQLGPVATTKESSRGRSPRPHPRSQPSPIESAWQHPLYQKTTATATAATIPHMRPIAITVCIAKPIFD
jgi:hypothetical protein